VDEHDYSDESGTPEDADADKESIEADKPVDLIPKTVFEYRPRVDGTPDLMVDMGTGVILGRSETFHRKYSAGGLGMLGAISESSDDILTTLLGMPVNLDLMQPHVMLVAGKRGSGKSYTLGIIAEELALAMERQEIEVAAVVIDTVDVFRQTIDPNLDQEDLLKKWGLEAKGFPAAVYIPRRTYVGLPDEVKAKASLYPLAISPRELTGSDWGYVLEKGGQLSTSMDNLIGEVLDSVRRGYVLQDGERVPLKRDFSIKDMIRCIEVNPAIIDLYKPSTRTAMVQRLRRADRLGVFHTGGTSAQDLAVAGQITIIDVAPLGSDAEAVLAILTNMLCRQVLTYRMAWTDEGTSAREELPPTWLIVDEAHTLVPRSGSTPAKDAIVGYAKLGRRFGCSLVLCTQQPSAVSDDAISQADIILSHSLSHDSDIRALQQRAPAVMLDQFRDKVFISSLPRGVALVFDQSTENKRGFIMKVRPRLSQHGGTDRLSGLFEASRLMGPDESDIEDVPLDDEILVSEEIDSEGALFEGLPEVPRPPLKLSKDDWVALDDWMKTYVESMFDRKMQVYTIIDEPAPRTDLQDTKTSEDDYDPSGPKDEPPTLPESIEPIELSDIVIREFDQLSDSTLEKAMRRKVLYSKFSHNFLFDFEVAIRDTFAIKGEGVNPKTLVELVVSLLVDSGMQVENIRNEEGFAFVFLRMEDTRAALSIGISDDVVCVPVTIIGSNPRKIAQLAEKLRAAFQTF
jgi:hypothetical protein